VKERGGDEAAAAAASEGLVGGVHQQLLVLPVGGMWWGCRSSAVVGGRGVRGRREWGGVGGVGGDTTGVLNPSLELHDKQKVVREGDTGIGRFG